MLLADVSFDKENNRCINQRGVDDRHEDLVGITTQKLRSIIKNSKPEKMAPGTQDVTSQNDIRSQNKLREKVRLGLLLDDETTGLKYLPRSPGDEKPAKDRSSIRRLKRVSFESSPPQTLRGNDVTCDVEARVQNGSRRCAKVKSETGARTRKEQSDCNEKLKVKVQISGSSERSDSEGAKSRGSHCSTCTCGLQSPDSPSEKHIKIDIGDFSPKSQDASRNLTTRIPIVAEKYRRGRRTESRDRNGNLRDPRETKSAGVPVEKMSFVKGANAYQCAWEANNGAADHEVNTFHDSKMQGAAKSPAEGYAMRKLAVTSPPVPCPSCSRVHGEPGAQVDGEGERLPHPADILFRIKRKHLRKRILSDSVATYAKECQASKVDVTSPHAQSSCSPHPLDCSHRRAMTDEKHLERMKENVTLSLKRCTLTSANARMLTDGERPFCSTPIPQKTTSPVKPESRTTKNGEKSSHEIILNRTFSISDSEEFDEELPSVETTDVDPRSPATPKNHAHKPLLTRRILDLTFSKCEDVCYVKNDVSPTVRNLDTSMMKSVCEIPKCSRLPPIPNGRQASTKVTVNQRVKKRQKDLMGLDLKGANRMEDLPPIVRDELKNKARMRLKQLTSPLPVSESGRNH